MSSPVEFLHRIDIVKAGEVQRDGRVSILMRVSSEKEDRQGEQILKSAFAEDSTRSEFIKEGYYDYNHLTDILDKQIQGASGWELVRLQKAKQDAIVGYPISLGLRDDFPRELMTNRETGELFSDGAFSQGFLFPENKFAVDIVKAMEAGWTGYGASISGTARREDIEGNTIKRMRLRKVAIQPLQESINDDTFVQLAKSRGALLLRKSWLDEVGLPDSQTAVNNEPMTESDASEVLTDIARLSRKIDALGAMLLRSPEIQKEIAADVAKEIKAGHLPLKYDAICDHLQYGCGLTKQMASEVANNILIEYGSK